MTFSPAIIFLLAATFTLSCVRPAVRHLSEAKKETLKVLGIPQESTRINEGSMAVITNADFYSYKIDVASRADCSQAADYSIAYPKSQPIYYEKLASENYIICVRDALPATGNSIAKSTANLYVGSFTIDALPPKIDDLSFQVYDRLDLQISASDLSLPIQLVWSQPHNENALHFLDQTGESISALIPSDGKSSEYHLVLDATDLAGNSRKTEFGVKVVEKQHTQPSLKVEGLIVANKAPLIRTSSAGQGPLSYEWDVLDGETKSRPWATNWQAKALDLRAVPDLADGLYHFQVTVTDAFHKSVSQKTKFLLDRVPPNVDAGTDQFKQLSQKVVLNGIAEDSSGIRSVFWRQVGGELPVRITHPMQLQSEVEFPSDFKGTAIFSLQAVDVAGNVSYDWVKVSIDSQAPFVEAPEKLSALTPSYHFQYLRAWDASPYTTHWFQSAGPEGVQIFNARSLSPTFGFSEAGEYEFIANVMDAAGNLTKKSTHISFMPQGQTEVDDDEVDSVEEDHDERVLVAEAKLPDIFGLNQIVRGKRRFIRPLIDLSHQSYRYRWRVLSGPGKLTLTRPNHIETGLRATKKGTYQIALDIMGSNGQVAKKSFSYFWDEDPPTIDFTASLESDALKLDSLVYDRSSTNINAQWTQVKGPLKLSSDMLTTDSLILSSSMSYGDYELKMSACDRFQNCSQKKIDISWPKNFHYSADFVSYRSVVRNVLEVTVANLPMIRGHAWQCEFRDLRFDKANPCQCSAGRCSVQFDERAKSLTSEVLSDSLRHFSYKIRLDGQLLYESGVSIDWREAGPSFEKSGSAGALSH